MRHLDAAKQQRPTFAQTVCVVPEAHAHGVLSRGSSSLGIVTSQAES